MIDRTKAYYTEQHNVIIPSNKQFLNVTIGERGSGKSATQELLLETLFEKGWAVFDAWSAGFEAMFYFISLDCKRKREERVSELQHKIRVATARHQAENVDKLEDELLRTKNELGCSCFKRYPITILINEAIDVDQKSLDKINGVYYSKEEWVSKMQKEGEILVEYDAHDPPEKPLSERGKEWIKIVKLPTPNVKDNTVNNKEIQRIFTEALLSCRKERRILSYIPALFPNSFSRYRTVGIIIEGLPDIMDEHFKPYIVGELGAKSSWTKYEANSHQLCILLREVGELAEDGMYSDPNAKWIKRQIQGIVRKSRHSHVSILFDLQRLSDFSKKIRSQVSSIILKRTPNKLLADELQYAKEWIESQQTKMFERYGNSLEVRDYVYSKYPPINQLNKNFFYALYSDDWIEKWEIPSTNHHHKQEDDDVSKLTGFSYKINQDILNKHDNEKTAENKLIDVEQKELFWFIHKQRNPKEGKPESWEGVQNLLIDEQKKGRFKKSSNFSKMKNDSIRVWFKRNSKNFLNS